MRARPLFAIALITIVSGASSSTLLAQAVDAPLQEVQVSGERPGPGLWRVQQGGHTLYLLGTMAPLPKKMQWRSREVESVLARAQEYLPGTPSVNVKAGPITALRLYSQWRRSRDNPDGVTLKTVLAPDLYARFDALRKKYAPRDGSIEERRPMLAAAKLYESAIEAIGLRQDTGVEDAVRKLARKGDVKIIEISQNIDDPRAALSEFSGIPRQAEVACFAATIDRLEADLGTMRSRAEAWAVGDVGMLRTQPAANQETACWNALNSAPQIARFAAEFEARWLAEAKRSLAENAVTFGAVPIGRLLQTDGVLDKLRAQGYEVIAP